MTVTPPPPYPLDAHGTDQHGENRALRERGPVASVELPGGLTAWAVTGHDELQALLGDQRVGKNPGNWRALQEGQVPEGWPLLGMVTIPGMTSADGADHRRLRGLVSQGFTPRRVEALRPHVESVVAELVERLERLAPGPVDLREHFAYPLPMRVIGELLGIPAELYDELHGHAGTLVRSSATPQEALAARHGLVELLGRVAADRRADPGDDMTSDLLAAREADDRLSEEEVVGTMMLMFIAGHATTLNLITNAVRALSAHPDQRDAALAGTVTWSAVVEETLRHDSPVAHFPLRFALDDIEVGGVVIRRGDAILASYAASGRDPRRHEDAERFDATRSPNRHLSFGHGLHFCLGAPLARLEAEVALRELYGRFPALVVAGETTPIASFVSNSVQSLPVALLD
ncbi:cytochrome P450 family protein [Streptacidiphilus neutrinimicus]|uniref:cytochrome P450 family protein n=1 Tax=Streptacidiphilus neutrinimicus TaxID=105420 RepID=UPI0005A74D55|nr:cytochrome P450 [Streptacidiphilus neutrinimicus]